MRNQINIIFDYFFLYVGCKVFEHTTQRSHRSQALVIVNRNNPWLQMLEHTHETIVAHISVQNCLHQLVKTISSQLVQIISMQQLQIIFRCFDYGSAVLVLLLASSFSIFLVSSVADGQIHAEKAVRG